MSTYLSHTISYGETLQIIAQSRLGDASRWVEIAILNDLVYPFIVDDPSEKTDGVKTIGDNILVPLTTGDAVDVIPSSEIADLYDEALGQDLSLFDDDDIELTSRDGGQLSSDIHGDLNIVKGVRNLRQAIILRLSTPLGSLLYHPEYGSTLNDLLGRKATSDGIQRIKVEIERCIRSDARVDDIDFDSVTMDGDVLKIALIITPVGFSVAFKMNLTFGEGGIVTWG